MIKVYTLILGLVLIIVISVPWALSSAAQDGNQIRHGKYLVE